MATQSVTQIAWLSGIPQWNGTISAIHMVGGEILVSSTTMEQPSSLEQLSQHIAEQARSLLEADGATVTRLKGNQLICIAASGQAAPLLGRHSDLSKSFTGTVLTGGRPRIFDPADRNNTRPESRARAQTNAIRSGIIVPIMIGGIGVGTVGVTSHVPGRFGAQDVKTLSGFAEEIGAHIEHMQTQKQLRRKHLREKLRLNRVASGADADIGTSIQEIQANVERLQARLRKNKSTS